MKRFKSYLKCSDCGKGYDIDTIQTICLDKSCKQPLHVYYKIPKNLKKSILKGRPMSMWRYIELLPIKYDHNIISLGEGATKMIKTEALGEMIGLKSLYIKDESSNPTGSFKSRGLSMAVSKAKELGIQKMAMPTAGNAGSALSAYCAAAGIQAKVYMPNETPNVFKVDCEVTGAEVKWVNGDISECAKVMQSENYENEWFDVSTMKEPYRLEGKKTMGFEIAEQFKWKLPDVILCPTGGGTGLVGIWKAFKELKRMGWIGHVPTRMVAVQVKGCSPIVNAFSKGKKQCNVYKNPIVTIANGLRVPQVFADKLVLEILYESNGTALAVSDLEIFQSVKEIAQKEGIFVAPEGGAVWAALKKLMYLQWIKPNEKVVMLNTGSAYKYIDNMLNYARKLNGQDKA